MRRRSVVRYLVSALALGGVGVALTGCAGALWTGPGYSVQSLFLYLRGGSLESAWQEIGPALQASNRPRATLAPDGRPALAIRWPSDRAFRREAAGQLAPFLRGARLRVESGSAIAHVVAYAASPSHAVAYFTLARVDNEWVVQRLVVAGGPA